MDEGFDVTVFEARDRVGGRVWTQTLEDPFGPIVIERGAEFVLHGYSETRGLLQHYGLGLVETGMSYYIREVGDLEGVSTEDVIAAGRDALRFVRDHAHEGALSAEDGLRGVDDRRLAEVLRARIEISAAAAARLVSASALGQIASIEPRPSWRIAGGNQSLPDAIAARLGARVRLGERVKTLIQDEAGVTIATRNESWRFDAAVVALPLAVLRELGPFVMHLPEWKRAALDHLVQGDAAKLHVPLSKEPGTSAVMSVRGRVWCWTAQSADGRVPPILNCFMGSAEALGAYGPDGFQSGWTEAVRRLRNDLEFVPGPRAVLSTWSDDPLSGGAYSALGAAATPADVEAIQRPVGAVFFAGEYTDPDYTGLMEGAIRSGHHAAAGVESALTGRVR